MAFCKSNIVLINNVTRRQLAFCGSNFSLSGITGTIWNERYKEYRHIQIANKSNHIQTNNLSMLVHMYIIITIIIIIKIIIVMIVIIILIIIIMIIIKMIIIIIIMIIIIIITILTN